jgi:hypothetical protein
MDYDFNIGNISILNTNIELEILRIKLINDTNTLLHQKFKLAKDFKLSNILISIDKKNRDPIFGKVIDLDIVYGKYNVTDSAKIIKFLNVEINKNIKLLKKFFTKSKDNTYNIKKKVINNNIILSYKSIDIRINKYSYNRIKGVVIDNSFKKTMKYDMLLFILYYRYINLGLYNGSQGAIHPDHYKQLSSKNRVNVECFGSFFNHTLKYYFGLFPDLEQYFGCLGNIFNSKLKEGFYVINPPFSIYHINRTILFILKQLNSTKFNLTILLVIPTWINENRIKLNKICKSQLHITNYTNEPDIEIDLLINSGFVHKYLLYCKNNLKYYNYLTNLDTNFAATTLILLSNNNNYNINNIFGNSNITLI